MADRNSNLRWGIVLPIGSPAPADPLGTLAWQVLKLVRRMGLLLVQNLEPASLDETEGSGQPSLNRKSCGSGGGLRD